MFHDIKTPNEYQNILDLTLCLTWSINAHSFVCGASCKQKTIWMEAKAANRAYSLTIGFMIFDNRKCVPI